MPYWTPPVNYYATLFTPPPLLPTVKVETKGASAYEQERIGQRAETLQVIPINRGEIEKTEKGDYIQQSRTVVTATATYDEQVTLTDIGAGTSSLAVVATGRDALEVLEPLYAPGPVVTEIAAPDAIFTQPDYGGFDVANYDPSVFQQGVIETAPSYDTSQPDDPFYQPETAPPPVYYQPLPVEQRPPDEPEVVQGDDGLAGLIAFGTGLVDALGGLFGPFLGGEEEPFV